MVNTCCGVQLTYTQTHTVLPPVCKQCLKFLLSLCNLLFFREHLFGWNGTFVELYNLGGGCWNNWRLLPPCGKEILLDTNTFHGWKEAKLSLHWLTNVELGLYFFLKTEMYIAFYTIFLIKWFWRRDVRFGDHSTYILLSFLQRTEKNQSLYCSKQFSKQWVN